MIKAVQNQLLADGVKANHKLLLALSGGSDSTALLYILKRLNYSFEVAHLNYQLRGEESNTDQDFVEKLCKKLGLKLHLKVVDTPEREKFSGSIQMQTREIRYQWFKELMEVHQFDFLCTAHHLNDSLESLFINWTRGTSIKGLMGIASTNFVLRPFQNIEKKQILRFLKENSIVFRTDSSNATDKYQRNWFRNHLVKPWAEEHKELFKQSKKNFENLRSVYAVYEQALIKDTSGLHDDILKGYLNYDSILKLEYPEASLAHLLADFGLNRERITLLIKMAKKPKVGARIELKEQFLLFDREKIFFLPYQENDEEKQTYLEAQNGELDYPLKLKHSILIGTKSKEELQDNKLILLDMDQVKFPLLIRKWQKGDKLKPIGLNGNKKVSDILIDQKVPLHIKNKAYVLESAGIIISLIGYKRSNVALVKDKTKRIFKIELAD